MAAGIKTTDVLDLNDILYDFQTSLEEYKKEAKILRQLLTRPYSRRLVRVAFRSMTMEEIAEGSTPDFQKTKYLEFNVPVAEYGLATGVTRNAIEDSSLNELQYALAEALEAAAQKENEVLMDCLKTGWYDGVPGNIVGGEIPNYGDRTFATTHTHVTDLGLSAPKTIFEMITASIQTIREHGFTADTLLINSSEMKTIMDAGTFTFTNTGFSADFQDRVASGIVDEISRSGKLGRIYGLNVIVNEYIEPGKICVVDAGQKPIAMVEIRGLTVEAGGGQFGIVDSYLSHRFGCKVVFQGAGVYADASL